MVMAVFWLGFWFEFFCLFVCVFVLGVSWFVCLVVMVFLSFQLEPCLEVHGGVCVLGKLWNQRTFVLLVLAVKCKRVRALQV